VGADLRLGPAVHLAQLVDDVVLPPERHPPRTFALVEAELEELTGAALAALVGPGAPVGVAQVPPAPGLYAVHGDEVTWRELGLGEPPDERPLYVGKAERSLAGRDIRTHFATGKTGSSTLRRTLAGLLAGELRLHGQPRNPDVLGYFSNFGLEATGDERLTTWMLQRLRLAAWPSPPRAPLGAIETSVLGELAPPLNIDKVKTTWRTPSPSPRWRSRDVEASAHPQSWEI